MEKNLENLDELQNQEEMDDDVICFEDEDGNEMFYREEMVLPVNGVNYALLVPLDEDEHDEECCCGECDDEDAAFFAKIIVNEDGEEEFIEPSDEEFELVCQAYEEFMNEQEQEEE